MKTTLHIHGMSAAEESATIQKRIQSVAGVSKVVVRFENQMAEVTHGNKVSADELKKAVRKAGYHATLPGEHHEEFRKTKTDMAVALGAGIPLLAVAFGAALGVFFLSPALALIEGALAIILIVAAKKVFSHGFRNAWRTKKFNPDTLIALAVSIAFLYSVATLAIWLSTGAYDASQIFFDVAGLVLLFVLLGRYAEDRARVRVHAFVESILAHVPTSAHLEKKGGTLDVLVTSLKAGDIIRVKPGEAIPADGVIVTGTTRVDESMLTGEQDAVKKTIRDVVYAGTINKTSMFLLEVTHTGKDTTFQNLVSAVEQTQRSQAAIHVRAQKISALLIPVVLGISLLSFLLWLAFPPSTVVVPLTFALNIALSVLIVASPAAILLSTPTAITVATAAASKRGILFTSARAMHNAAFVRMVAFEKTGVLSVGTPQVKYIKTYQKMSEHVVMRYAASLESAGDHSIGTAIVNAAKNMKIGIAKPRAYERVPGMGVFGKVEGRKVLLGSIPFLQERGIGIYDLRERMPELARKQMTGVAVVIEGKLAGLIGVYDPLKKSTKPAVELLTRQGLGSLLLSGDQENVARTVASKAGIKVVRAPLLGRQKNAEFKKLQKRRPVAMVGKLPRDASLMKHSDASIALGGALDQRGASIVLLQDDMMGVPRSLHVARRAIRVVRQNASMAYGYNIIAIPIAAGILFPATGWVLSPIVAGAIMAASSLPVMLNSLRVRKI